MQVRRILNGTLTLRQAQGRQLSVNYRLMVVGFLLLGLGLSANAQRIGEISKDTARNASFGRYMLSAMNDTLYMRSNSGDKIPIATIDNWLQKWDSVRAAGFSVDNMSVDNDFVVNGYADLNSGRLNSFIIEEIADGTDNYGNNGEVLVKRGSMKWDSLEVVDIVGMNEYVRADTLGGRAVFQLPSYVADLIPDSSHIAIEPDFIKAYQINGAFGIVPLGYPVVSVGLDSTEITLPKPNYDLVWEIFCTCFDDTVFGVYDTVQYKIPVQGGDSITMYKPQSILYFSDTIWVDAGNTYKFTNYLSNEHPINQFRSGNHYLGSRIAWDNKQQKFFIQ